MKGDYLIGFVGWVWMDGHKYVVGSYKLVKNDGGINCWLMVIVRWTNTMVMRCKDLYLQGVW